MPRLDSGKSDTNGILLISTRLYPDIGGPASYVFNLAKALTKHRVFPVVLTTQYNMKAKILPDAPCHLYRLPFAVPDVKSSLLKQAVFSGLFLLLGILYGTFACLRHGIRIIHTNSPVISGLLGLILSRILRLPLLYTVHGLTGVQQKWRRGSVSPVDRILEYTVLKHSHLVTVVSPDYVKHVESISSRPAVIGSGVDVERFNRRGDERLTIQTNEKLGINEGKVVLTTVTNLEIPEKASGVEDIIHAISSFDSNTRQRVAVLVVGSGARMNHLRALAQSLSVDDTIRFLGYRTDVPTILKASDVFVLASHHEGSPIALLEAAASGCACIGSKTGGIPGILESECLFTPGDRMALASKLEELVTNPERRRKLALVQSVHVRSHFSWDQIAHLMVLQYSRLSHY